MNRKSNLVVLGYLLMVFLAGAVVGGFADRTFFPGKETRLTPEQYKARIITELNKRLKLQPDQLNRLDGIFDETGDHFRAIHKKIDTDLNALRSEHDDRVRAILTAEQRTEYDKWRAEREKQRAAEQRH